MNTNRIITAVFGNKFMVTLMANNDKCTIEGAGEYRYGEEITVTAKATDNDLIFVRWTIDGKEVSKDITYTFTVIKSVDLVAEFFEEEKGYRLYAESVGDGGKVSEDVYVKKGKTGKLTATPSEGYIYYQWRTIDNNLITHENDCIISEIKEDTKLIAIF